MVKDRNETKNVPSKKSSRIKSSKQEQLVGELDWSYKFLNEEPYQITRRKSLSKFCEVQYLKYID